MGERDEIPSALLFDYLPSCLQGPRAWLPLGRCVSSRAEDKGCAGCRISTLRWEARLPV